MPEIWRQLNEPGVTAAPSTASDPSQVTTTAQSDTADTTGDGTSEDSTASLVTTSDTLLDWKRGRHDDHDDTAPHRH